MEIRLIAKEKELMTMKEILCLVSCQEVTSSSLDIRHLRYRPASYHFSFIRNMFDVVLANEKGRDG